MCATCDQLRVFSGGAIILICAVWAAEQIVLGANGPLLGAIAATANLFTLAIVALFMKPQSALWRQAVPILIALAIALSWLCVPNWALPISSASRPSPDLWLSGFVRISGYLAILLAAAMIGYRRGMRYFAVRWIVAFGLLDLLIGMALAAIEPGKVWGQDKGIIAERFSGTLLNANGNACMSAMIVLLALAVQLVEFRERRSGGETPNVGWLIVMISATIVGTASCLASGSRMVTILLLIAVGCELAVDRALRKPGQWVYAASAATLLALVGGLFAATIGPDLIERFNDGSLAVDSRRAPWAFYVGLVRESPWFGYGPLGFDGAVSRHLQTPLQASQIDYIHAPHNLALSMLMTGGWPYLLAMTSGAALVAWQIFRARTPGKQDPVQRGLVLAVLLMTTAATVDIEFDIPSLITLAALLTGLAWGRAMRRNVEQMEYA